jgi:hypothetical protein
MALALEGSKVSPPGLADEQVPLFVKGAHHNRSSGAFAYGVGVSATSEEKWKEALPVKPQPPVSR